MEKKSTKGVKNRICPVCGGTEFEEVSSLFSQCVKCKVLVDFNNQKLHVPECPLCGSKELSPLPSGNILCEGCKNSFVAGKIENNHN